MRHGLRLAGLAVVGVLLASCSSASPVSLDASATSTISASFAFSSAISLRVTLLRARPTTQATTTYLNGTVDPGRDSASYEFSIERQPVRIVTQDSYAYVEPPPELGSLPRGRHWVQVPLVIRSAGQTALDRLQAGLTGNPVSPSAILEEVESLSGPLSYQHGVDLGRVQTKLYRARMRLPEPTDGSHQQASIQVWIDTAGRLRHLELTSIVHQPAAHGTPAELTSITYRLSFSGFGSSVGPGVPAQNEYVPRAALAQVSPPVPLNLLEVPNSVAFEGPWAVVEQSDTAGVGWTLREAAASHGGLCLGVETTEPDLVTEEDQTTDYEGIEGNCGPGPSVRYPAIPGVSAASLLGVSVGLNQPMQYLALALDKSFDRATVTFRGGKTELFSPSHDALAIVWSGGNNPTSVTLTSDGVSWASCRIGLDEAVSADLGPPPSVDCQTYGIPPEYSEFGRN